MGPGAADEAFSPNNAGQWLPPHEDMSGPAPKLTGLVRPVFEVKPKPISPAAGAQGPCFHLEPILVPGRSAVRLLTVKKIVIPPMSFVALG